MKICTAFAGLILLLFFMLVISGCHKDHTTKSDTFTVIGLVITQGDKTRVNYAGDETVTGELNLEENKLSVEFQIQFIKQDQSVITPSTDKYRLVAEIADKTICTFYQAEDKAGGYVFQLDAREKKIGNTTIVFKLMEGTNTVFTSKTISIRVHVDENKAPAWVWAYNGTAATLQAYHSVTGEMKAQFTASAHPMMHIIHAGPAEKPTIWMAKSGTASAFTAGFLTTQTPAKMETPAVYATLTTGKTPVHTGVAPDGMTVAFANDGDQTVSVIDVAGRSVRAVANGSGHSAALLTGPYLITTSATPTQEKWAKIIDLSANAVVQTIETATGAHGDAFYAAGNKAFIACGDGIYVIDVAAKSLKKSLPYTQPGRTNFLYHGEKASLTVGLHKTESGTSDKILLLDMAAESLEYLTVSGATLDWKIQNGYFALSQDGKVAVLADLALARVYHVNVQTRTVTTLTAPAAAVAVATNHSGTHVWMLDKTRQKVSCINVAKNARTDEFSVTAGTEWIFVTSHHGQVVE